jgi:hypothetical protein
MKDALTSVFRHLLTGAAGLGAFLAAQGIIGPGDVADVDAAGLTLADALGVFIAIVLTRAALFAAGKVVSGGKAQGLPLVIGLSVGAAVFGTALPSCTPASMRVGINWAAREAAYEVIEATK